MMSILATARLNQHTAKNKRLPDGCSKLLGNKTRSKAPGLQVFGYHDANDFTSQENGML